jgi:hypothetical protein
MKQNINIENRVKVFSYQVKWKKLQILIQIMMLINKLDQGKLVFYCS